MVRWKVTGPNQPLLVPNSLTLCKEDRSEEMVTEGGDGRLAAVERSSRKRWVSLMIKAGATEREGLRAGAEGAHSDI